MTELFWCATAIISAFVVGYMVGNARARAQTREHIHKLLQDCVHVYAASERVSSMLNRIDPRVVAMADAEQRIAEAEAAEKKDDVSERRIMALGDEVLKQYLYEDHDEGSHAETEDDDDDE